jgi:hypothetical protein
MRMIDSCPSLLYCMLGALYLKHFSNLAHAGSHRTALGRAMRGLYYSTYFSKHPFSSLLLRYKIRLPAGRPPVEEVQLWCSSPFPLSTLHIWPIPQGRSASADGANPKLRFF